MIKAVLFDLDGTLLNREASLAYFVEQQYERLGSFLGQVSKHTYIKQFIEFDAQVGDNPTVDIEAAQKYGMRGVWKKSHCWGHCASADAVCEKLEQIPSIVQDLELHL